MTAMRDITGERFSKLTALWPAGRHGKNSKIVWAVQCDCGTVRAVQQHLLVSGDIKSCSNCKVNGMFSHGHASRKNSDPNYACGKQTREYTSFLGARSRCNDPNNAKYYRYGARGIEFRFKSFQEFYATLGPKPIGSILDRIDNDGHYEAGNVRWTNYTVSNRNRGICRKGRLPLV